MTTPPRADPDLRTLAAEALDAIADTPFDLIISFGPASGGYFRPETVDLILRRLAAAAPPAGLSAPVPAENAPAVPEEAGGQRAGEGDALAAEWLTADGVKTGVELALGEAQETIRGLWIELEYWRNTLVNELTDNLAKQRDETLADRDRLAAHLAQFQDVAEKAKAWVAVYGKDVPTARLYSAECDLLAAVDALSDAGTDQTEAHDYLSTACFHGKHRHCLSTVSAHGGTKVPGQCKFCEAICRCPVCRHDGTAPEGADERNGHG